MLSLHLGAIGWLLLVDKGFFAIIANSIVYTIPLIITYHINIKNKFLVLFISWIGFEIIINTFAISTPLLTIGNSLSNNVYLIQWFRFTTVIGGSIWLIILSYLIFIRKHFLTLFVFIIPVLFSIYLYKTNIQISEKTTNVGIFNSRFLEINRILNHNKAMYIQKETKNINDLDLLLLPETMFQFDLSTYKNTIDYTIFKKIVAQKNIKSILIGSQMNYKNNKLNTAILLSKNNSFIKIKKKLVPFTEYIPKQVRFIFNKKTFLHNFMDNSESIKKEYQFTPLICYEGFFPFFVKKESKKTKFITVISSESFLKNSFYGEKLYNNILKLRAIENNLPLIKCSNINNSIYINKKGIIIDESNKNEFYIFNVSI